MSAVDRVAELTKEIAQLEERRRHLHVQRLSAVALALHQGATQAQLVERTGLTRGRISQLVAESVGHVPREP